MEELNDMIEGLLVDVAEEGVGTTAGIGMLWGLFFCGSYALFAELLNLLVTMF